MKFEPISMVLAIICLLIIALVGLKTNILRESNDSTKPFSFSRFQLWLWLLVIVPAFALTWKLKDGSFPVLTADYLILLGVPAGVTLTAGVISAAQKSAKAKNSIEGDAEGLKSERSGISFWADILMDDSAQFSVTRLQNLVFTIAYVIMFASMFLANKKLPEFGDSNIAFALMGMSSGVYLLGKGLNK